MSSGAPEGREVAAALIAGLVRRGQTLATAESLTGGLLGAAITAVPGSSAVYRGGLITYATDLKGSLAGVEQGILDRYGPVAAETARQLAAGAARVCVADWGVAVTGVAGPDRQDGHPVGQVFVGLAGPGGDVAVVELALEGSRAEIRAATVVRALALAARAIGP